MAGKLMPARFRLVASFGFGREESASKPPQAICKTLCAILNLITHEKYLYFSQLSIATLASFLH